MLTQIDHVGIAVTALDEEVERYRRTFGLEPVHRERMADQGVEEVLFAVGESYVQLLGALGPDTPVGRFLDKRGPGVHHLGYRVADVPLGHRDLLVIDQRTEVVALARTHLERLDVR